MEKSSHTNFIRNHGHICGESKIHSFNRDEFVVSERDHQISGVASAVGSQPSFFANRKLLAEILCVNVKI